MQSGLSNASRIIITTEGANRYYLSGLHSEYTHDNPLWPTGLFSVHVLIHKEITNLLGTVVHIQTKMPSLRAVFKCQATIYSISDFTYYFEMEYRPTLHICFTELKNIELLESKR